MAPRYLSQDEVVALLEHKRGSSRQKDFAAKVGVSAPFLANVMSKERYPSDVVLNFLGLEDAGKMYRVKARSK